MVDRELPDIPYAVVPGHDVVDRVLAAVPAVGLAPGFRVGVPRLDWDCGQCRFCVGGLAHLCDEAAVRFARDLGAAAAKLGCAMTRPETGAGDPGRRPAGS